MLRWLIKKQGFAQMRSFWADKVNQAWGLSLGDLSKYAQEGKGLRNYLSEFLSVADTRLAYPRIGSSQFKKPADADWGWRPEIWRGQIALPGRASVASKSRLGGELTLFHDCGRAEISMRQLRNTSPTDLAPYGLRLDVLNFEGSYLSLALNLDGAASENIRAQHLIQVAAIVEMETITEIYGRLNLKHGPNTEQIVQQIKMTGTNGECEFDLAFLDFNEKRVERIWLDLIFDKPEMNQMTIRDVTMVRRMRADF